MIFLQRWSFTGTLFTHDCTSKPSSIEILGIESASWLSAARNSAFRSPSRQWHDQFSTFLGNDLQHFPTRMHDILLVRSVLHLQVLKWPQRDGTGLVCKVLQAPLAAYSYFTFKLIACLKVARKFRIERNHFGSAYSFLFAPEGSSIPSAFIWDSFWVIRWAAMRLVRVVVQHGSKTVINGKQNWDRTKKPIKWWARLRRTLRQCWRRLLQPGFSSVTRPPTVVWTFIGFQWKMRNATVIISAVTISQPILFRSRYAVHGRHPGSEPVQLGTAPGHVQDF